jgi:hypothetical protein
MKIYRREKMVEIYVKTHSAENLATPENRHSGALQIRQTAMLSRITCASILTFVLWKYV